MHRSLLFKAIVIGFLILAILVPLSLIRSTIAERQSYRQQAIASIAGSYAGAQALAGPMVIVPYRIDVTSNEVVNGVTQSVTRIEQRQWLFFPKSLQIDGDITPHVRKRGLYDVRVYELHAKLASRFELALPSQVDGGTMHDIGIPVLSVGISDVRGLIGTPQLQVDGRNASLMQGPATDRVAAGLHADLPVLAAGQARGFDVTMDFVLGGTEDLAIAPIADNNRIALKSTWPSPQFAGRFLPHKETVSAKGFDAAWEISALAANTQRQIIDGTDAKGGVDRLELTLMDPVDMYTQVDRASKYGLLFVLLTFVGFFMFETMKQLRIHPIQYVLAGLGLAIFFLLLLSLSEHIPFVWSYIIASAACIGLLGFYLAHVLQSRARGLGFATMLTALYAVLYGLLISEDNALVLGSILLFAILAAIMAITRKVDWYGIGSPRANTVERNMHAPDVQAGESAMRMRAADEY